MAGFQQGLKKTKKAKRNDQGTIGHGFLSQIAPRKGYIFHSDYFEIDNSYATILTVFNKDGADRHLYTMWGVSLLPRGLGNNVTARLFTQVEVADEKWVQKHQVNADIRNNAQQGEAARSKKSKDRRMSMYRSEDLDQISSDLISGDSYMYVTFKELVKAPSLDELDQAVGRIQRNYDKTFGGIYTDRYEGQQRVDFENFFKPASQQIGKAYMFTASELAGEYNILTQGISDDYGEYVGQMKGDINDNAVLWDIDDFDRSVIVASNDPAKTVSVGVNFPENTRGSGMWGVKIAQSALINRHRVVHLVLNGTKVPQIGKDLSDITTYIPMHTGAINPFEMFGNPEDELSIFPAQLNKIELMAKQISPSLNDIDLNLHLTDILTEYYEDLGMWHDNAKNFRNDLKLVGLPHQQYPLLEKFNAYLAERRDESADKNNLMDVNSIEKLQSAFNTMLSANGDLFDQYTDPNVDGASSSQNVVYDFSSLAVRNPRIMMAQFVNALDYAVSGLQSGDVLEIYGFDMLDPSIFTYLQNTLSRLYKINVRIVYLYDDIDTMLDQAKLNRFADANWTLTGTMPQATITHYQKVLDLTIPKNLIDSLRERLPQTYFLRRGPSNIIFDADLVLDVYNSN